MTVKGEASMRKKKKRRVVSVVVLVLLAVIGFMGWNFLKPLVVESSETTYASYTVETGSITNTMSFSASVALLRSETHTATAETTVRKVYVEESQAVSKGDKLVQLANGELYKAEIDGTVNEIPVAENDTVYPNTTLAQICDLENMQVTLRVDEYDIDKVSVGQKCTVTILSLGQSFETEIAHINRISASQGNVAYYSVTAQIEAPDNVMPGMQATVTIPSAEAINVAILDMNAFAFEEKQPYVLQKAADGSYEKVFVEVGMNDGLSVEIKNGLSVGDVVYAVSGAETVEPLFTVQDIYTAIVGESIVINDMSASGMEMFGTGGMPFGEGAFDPENLPEDMDFSQFGTPPDGMSGDVSGEVTMPESMSSTQEESTENRPAADVPMADQAGEIDIGEVSENNSAENAENSGDTGTGSPSERSEKRGLSAPEGEAGAAGSRGGAQSGNRPSESADSSTEETFEDGGMAND